MGGQLRVVPGAVLGWDLGTAIAMASALGINPLIVAEILPALEAVTVKALNDKIVSGGLEGGDVRDVNGFAGKGQIPSPLQVQPELSRVAKEL